MNHEGTQIHEDQMKCHIHQLKMIAVGLDLSNNGQFSYLCCNCLVEQMNNYNILTFEQIQQWVQSYTAKKQQQKLNSITIILEQFKLIQVSIKKFKSKADEILKEIESQITKKISTFVEENQFLEQQILKEKEILEKKKIEKKNDLPPQDVKFFLQIFSTPEQQDELQQKILDVDTIFKNFELISNDQSYIDTIQAFKNAKQKITVVNVGNQIEKMPKQIKNNKKSLSLKILCKAHDKEISHIDIESKNKNIEDRFACPECMSHPGQEVYGTIEKVNQSWNDKIEQQNQVGNELKVKKQKKQEKLNEKIAKMRKNYNEQLNKINDQLKSDFSSTNEIIQFKQTYLEQLNKEELLQNLKYLIQYEDKDKNTQDPKIKDMITKNTNNSKDIEKKLSQLIFYKKNQVDDNQIQGIILLFEKIQGSSQANQEQLMKKQELDEFISSSNQIYCQLDLLNQTISQFQQHLKEIISIQDKIKSISDQQYFINIEKQFKDYKDQFEKDFQHLKKFCEMEEAIKKWQFDLELSQQNSIKQDQTCFAIAVNKDFTILIAGCNNQIQVFEFIQGILKQVQVLSEHGKNIHTLNFMKRSNYFISGSVDNSIIIWARNQNNSWIFQQKLNGHTGSILCLLLNNNEDIIVSGSHDYQIKFWQKQNGWLCSQTITDHTSTVYGLSFNEQQNRLISCGDDNIILVIEQLELNKQWIVIQKITVEQFGCRLCFIDNNRFTFYPYGKDYINVFEMNNSNKQYTKTKDIPVKSGNIYDNSLFSSQYIKLKCMLVNKNGQNVSLIRLKQNGEFMTEEIIDFGTRNLFGYMTDDGQYLITWDGKSKEIQIRKYQEK
ncbi:unnamed protein product [Paramecium pentaurelia]|uniref:WD40-repeat-containing domain n=1 Tax=Paramecium pentaurelia TaxID=43138 RepID=A0A8S1XUP5_9CILI|nr:unnamed protein product [Paramecium pentaurelia]